MLAAPRNVAAEINVGESLDWLTFSRPHIAVVEITGIVDNNKPAALWLTRTVRTQTKSRLKGRPLRNASFSRSVPNNVAAPIVGTEFVLFFDDKMDADYAVSLGSPPESGAEVAFTMDFGILRAKDTILKVVKHRLAGLEQQPSNMRPTPRARNVFTSQRGSLRLHVPFGTPAALTEDELDDYASFFLTDQVPSQS